MELRVCAVITRFIYFSFIAMTINHLESYSVFVVLFHVLSGGWKRFSVNLEFQYLTENKHHALNWSVWQYREIPEACR